MYVVSKFVSGATFAIIPYSENISSLAVACWSKIIRNKPHNGVVFASESMLTIRK